MADPDAPVAVPVAPVAAPDAPLPAPKAEVKALPADLFASWPTVDAAYELEDGFVAQVNRGLGLGDSPVWSDSTEAGVLALKERAGLDAAPSVSGVAWALFVPVYAEGDNGAEVAVLRMNMGLGDSHWLDAEMADALEAATGSRNLDQTTWAKYVGLTLAPIEVPVDPEEPPPVEPPPEEPSPEVQAGP